MQVKPIIWTVELGDVALPTQEIANSKSMNFEWTFQYNFKLSRLIVIGSENIRLVGVYIGGENQLLESLSLITVNAIDLFKAALPSVKVGEKLELQFITEL